MEDENVEKTKTVLDNRNLGIIIHLLGLLTGFIAPLIFYLVSDKEIDKKHAKVVLNWQISMMIYCLISGILTLLLIGIIGLIVFPILNIVFGIVGMIKASEGVVWEYPMSIKFLK